MKIIKINSDCPEKDLLEIAAKIICRGGVIGYPTETIYGLGADALNETAVEKVFNLKDREKNKPILVIAENIRRVKELTRFFPRVADILAEEFWPGPLTIVFYAGPVLSRWITGETKTVGIRIPANRICLELIQLAGVPITSTSANLSGGKNPVTAREVRQYFGDQLDLIIDGGHAKASTPSTVISAIDNKIKLLRPGAIEKSEIERILGFKIYE